MQQKPVWRTWFSLKYSASLSSQSIPNTAKYIKGIFSNWKNVYKIPAWKHTFSCCLFRNSQRKEIQIFAASQVFPVFPLFFSIPFCTLHPFNFFPCLYFPPIAFLSHSSLNTVSLFRGQGNDPLL